MLALYELMDLLPKTFEPKLRPKLKELFLFLRRSGRMEEQVAAQQFLNGNKSHFNKLKNELKNALCTDIITNPSTWADNEQKLLYDYCYKAFAAYKILLGSSSREAAMERAGALLPKLSTLEIHGLIFIVALDLHFHYSSMKIVPKLAKKYAMIIEEQADFIRVEAIVRICYGKAGMLCNNRSSFPPSVVRELQEMETKCRPYLSLGSTSLNRIIYDIIAVRYIVAYDYENIVKHCDEALDSFAAEHPNYNALCFDFFAKKIPALVCMGELEKAKRIAREAGKMMPVGAINWQVVLIRRIVICLHMADYQEAYDLFKAHSKYTCTYQILVEYWKIIEGFLYFLILAGRIQQYSEERFMLGKFLNEVPIYSRDKAGNNINILLIQILLQMHRGEYGKIIDRVESLREYARNYTRNPETKRANLFINMILKMEAASFHRAGTERRTKGLLKKLHATPLSLAQNLSIEIIPYPVLWTEILEMLENKFRALKLNKKGSEHPDRNS